MAHSWGSQNNNHFFTLVLDRVGKNLLEVPNVSSFHGIEPTNIRLFIRHVQVISHPENEYLYTIESTNNGIYLPDHVANTDIRSGANITPQTTTVTNVNGGKHIVVPVYGNVPSPIALKRGTIINYSPPRELLGCSILMPRLELEVHGANEFAAVAGGATAISNPEDVADANFKIILHMEVQSLNTNDVR